MSSSLQSLLKLGKYCCFFPVRSMDAGALFVVSPPSHITNILVHISNCTFFDNEGYAGAVPSSLPNFVNAFLAGLSLRSPLCPSICVPVQECMVIFRRVQLPLFVLTHPCCRTLFLSLPFLSLFAFVYGFHHFPFLTPTVTGMRVRVRMCMHMCVSFHICMCNVWVVSGIGGALSVIRVSAENKPTFNPCIIEDSVFDNNSLSSDKSWKDQVYIYTTGGGALFDHMNVTILRSHFSNNQ